LGFSDFGSRRLCWGWFVGWVVVGGLYWVFFLGFLGFGWVFLGFGVCLERMGLYWWCLGVWAA
jgi:hypothetical protein